MNQVAVAAMAEKGIDMSDVTPRKWDDETIRSADVVITMGCGDTCPYFPGKTYLDWEVEDPAGLPVEKVRPIRDDIERRVRQLLTNLGIQAV